MRIDSHIHLFDPVYGEFAWPPRNSDFFRLFSAENYAKELGGEETGAVVVGCSNEYELNEKLRLTTFESTDLGVAFLIEDEHQLIYHAGDFVRSCRRYYLITLWTGRNSIPPRQLLLTLFSFDSM